MFIRVAFGLMDAIVQDWSNDWPLHAYTGWIMEYSEIYTYTESFNYGPPGQLVRELRPQIDCDLYEAT
jgi:hypothetical protein